MSNILKGPFSAFAGRMLLASVYSSLFMGCGSSTGPAAQEPIASTPPRQLAIAGAPSVALRFGEVFAPDTALVFSVTAPDSTPHAEWFPTRLLVETDRGYREEVLLVPYACLEPAPFDIEFPFNFNWPGCNEVGINTRRLLSENQVAEIETLIDGNLSIQRNFRTMPGATYIFTTPVGREAVATALRRVEQLQYVDEGYRTSHTPPCVLSDIVPPPACPPWLLVKKMKFSHTGAARGVLPVSAGGWVRVTYTQPDGAEKSAVFRFPTPNAGGAN